MATCTPGTKHCTTDCLFTLEPCRSAGSPDVAYNFRTGYSRQTLLAPSIKAAVAAAVATFPHKVRVAYGEGTAAIIDARPRRRRVLGVVEAVSA